MRRRTFTPLHYAFTFSLLSLAGAGEAATIYASGQRLTQAIPGVHDDIRENFVYRIDVATGTATAVSPATTGLPSALGMKPDGSLWGFRSGNLGTVDIPTGSFTPLASGGPNATAFDFGADGIPYAVPFNDDFRTQQLFRFEQATDAWQSIGSVTAIGDAIDAKRGTDPGTAQPFVIGLGVVGETAYGIDLDTYSLIGLDRASGVAGVVGEVGAVQSDWRSGFTGFSALTGVDTDADGAFDSLFGAVNFWDHDADPTTPAFRFGGLAMFDLATGQWDLVGFNEGVIYFGMASAPAPIPLPAAAWLLAPALGVLARRRKGS